MTAAPEIEPDVNASRPVCLSLLESLKEWVDPKLIEEIRRWERRHTFRTLVARSGPLLSDPSELVPHTTASWMAGPPDFTMLDAAWKAAVRDLGLRVQNGELHLEGVEYTDDLQTQPQAIPGAFAMKMQFNVTDGTLKLGKRHFLSVTVSREPSAWAPLELNRPMQPANQRQLDVTLLSDEQIIELLEEHAKRVIAGPDSKLIAPGKISLMPIIAGKMRERARNSELMGKISHEAEWLAKWIASKVTLHQVPTASTIEKKLGKEYAVLKPTSNTAIPRLKV